MLDGSLRMSATYVLDYNVTIIYDFVIIFVIVVTVVLIIIIITSFAISKGCITDLNFTILGLTLEKYLVNVMCQTAKQDDCYHSLRISPHLKVMKKKTFFYVKI